MADTALVTGASGFIGRFLVLALLQRGVRVFVLLRRPAQQLATLKSWLVQYGVDPGALLLPIRGDLSVPDLAISQADWRAMAQVRVIYHCGAAYFWGMRSTDARQVNVSASVRLLELAAQHLHLHRFVHTAGFMLSIHSHLRQLGIDPEKGRQDWTSVYRRVGAYEASKLESHFAVKRTSRALGIPLTVIHPSAVIGHSQTGEIALSQDVAKTIDKLLHRKLPAIPKGYLPMVSVDDLTHFMAEIVNYPESVGQEYVMANSAQINLESALRLCAEIARVPMPLFTIPASALKAIANVGFIGRLFDIDKEALNFIRPAKIDTGGAAAMMEKMKLMESTLRDSLENTVEYLKHTL